MISFDIPERYFVALLKALDPSSCLWSGPTGFKWDAIFPNCVNFITEDSKPGVC